MAIACNLCPAPHAAVHLTEIAPDGTVQELHLCRACVERLKIDLDRPQPISELMAGAVPSPASTAGETAPVDLHDREACPGCGLTFADYLQTNIFGCPRCFTTFAGPVQELLSRYHGADRHAGRVPIRAPTEPGTDLRAARRQAIRAAIDLAVEREQFERAAVLRDELAALEDEP